MAMYLDDEPAAFAGDDLASIINAAKEQLESAGRIVVEVRVGGQPLTGEQLDNAADITPGDQEVRLYSADPRELAVLTLEQVRGRLDEARSIQEQAADELHRDRVGEGFGKVGQLVEIWQQTQEAVRLSAGLAGVRLDELTIDEQPVQPVIDELLERLEQLRILITNVDTVAVADVLAYEWPEVVDHWDGLVRELETTIGGTAK